MTEREILVIIIFLAMVLSFAVGAAFGVMMSERNQKKLKELITEVHDNEANHEL